MIGAPLIIWFQFICEFAMVNVPILWNHELVFVYLVYTTFAISEALFVCSVALFSVQGYN